MCAGHYSYKTDRAHLTREKHVHGEKTRLQEQRTKLFKIIKQQNSGATMSSIRKMLGDLPQPSKPRPRREKKSKPKEQKVLSSAAIPAATTISSPTTTTTIIITLPSGQVIKRVIKVG